MLQILCSVTKL